MSRLTSLSDPYPPCAVVCVVWCVPFSSEAGAEAIQHPITDRKAAGCSYCGTLKLQNLGSFLFPQSGILGMNKAGTVNPWRTFAASWLGLHSKCLRCALFVVCFWGVLCDRQSHRDRHFTPPTGHSHQKDELPCSYPLLLLTVPLQKYLPLRPLQRRTLSPPLCSNHHRYLQLWSVDRATRCVFPPCF